MKDYTSKTIIINIGYEVRIFKGINTQNLNTINS